ncbi:MAG: DUF3108 domain-containing protein [Rhodocyclaceae bacterium]
MLPLWLALAASLTLHLGVLLSPGWSLPMQEEPMTQRLDATLVLAPVPPPAPASSMAPIVQKTPRGKAAETRPAEPPAPVEPQASLPESASPPVEPDAPPLRAPDESESPPAADMADMPRPADSPDHGAARPADSPDHGAASPAPTFASRWPTRGRIVYQVSRGDKGFVLGQTEWSWEYDATHYTLQTVAETTGLVGLFRPVRVIQTSRGGFDAFGVRPQVFVIEREGREAERVDFAADGMIVFSRGGSVPFVDGAQDLLSVFFQLAGWPLDEPEYGMRIATARKLGEYRIAVDAESILETPQGRRPAQHLTVTGRPGEDVTEIWLDVETRLPLKIRHRDRKGEVYDQTVSSIEIVETDLPR